MNDKHFTSKQCCLNHITCSNGKKLADLIGPLEDHNLLNGTYRHIKTKKSKQLGDDNEDYIKDSFFYRKSHFFIHIKFNAGYNPLEVNTFCNGDISDYDFPEMLDFFNKKLPPLNYVPNDVKYDFEIDLDHEYHKNEYERDANNNVIMTFDKNSEDNRKPKTILKNKYSFDYLKTLYLDFAKSKNVQSEEDQDVSNEEEDERSIIHNKKRKVTRGRNSSNEETFV